MSSIPVSLLTLFTITIGAFLFTLCGLALIQWQTLKRYKKLTYHLSQHLNHKRTKLLSKRHHLSGSQQAYMALQTSHKAYKRLSSDLLSYLDVKSSSLFNLWSSIYSDDQNGSSDSLSTHEQIQVFNSCIGSTRNLFNSYPSFNSPQQISLCRIFKHIQELFAERVQKYELDYSFTCNSNLSVECTPPILTIILFNLIGKRLYTLPQDGWLKISATENKGFISVRIIDNGFNLTPRSQQFVENSNEFFWDKEITESLCRDNGIYLHSHIRGKHENIKTFSLRMTINENKHGNVVELRR